MVFGGDAGSVGGADGGGTVGAVVGGGRHEDGAAGNDVGDDFGSIVDRKAGDESAPSRLRYF